MACAIFKGQLLNKTREGAGNSGRLKAGTKRRKKFGWELTANPSHESWEGFKRRKQREVKV